MARSRSMLPFLAVALGSCSYAYHVKAVVVEGQLAFIVDPSPRHDPSCVNAIDVIASGGVPAKAAAGDDVSRVKYGTFWYERHDYACTDEFPIFYGQKFKWGRRPLSEVVAEKPLNIGVVYEVTTTTGATGYGSGAFKILPDRTVINVPPPPLAKVDDAVDPVIGNGS